MPIQRVLAAEGAGNDEGYIGYPIQKYQAIDIDTMDDWQFAELVFNGILKMAKSS
jgi:CMP-N-acetylneuraminic acid synthetase